MASPCNTYCATPFPTFDPNECGDTIAGGIQGLIAFACDSDAVTTSDFTGATINTDIANGKAFVLEQVKASIAAASPNANSTSYVAGQEPKTGSYTQTVTVMDANVTSANSAALRLIDSTNGTEIAALIVTTVETEKSQLLLPLKSFQYTGSTVTPDTEDDAIHYEGSFVGKVKHGVTEIIDTPTGVYSFLP